MHYESVSTVINASGLRVVLLAGFPSPWGVAAKMMMDYKGLDFLAAPLEAGSANAEVVAWAGINSAPVVALDDEAPINRWDDIVLLLERLAPHKPLLPPAGRDRALMFGMAHEICGQLGFGWNRRLDMFRPMMESGEPPQGVVNMAAKYGYNESDVAQANRRAIATLGMLADQLKAQQAAGSDYFIGNEVTALDFYWTTFSNLVELMPTDVCPVDDAIKPMFENTPAEVAAALDPVLLAHRDRILERHCKVPLEL